jgi:N-acetyltransferase 10
MIPWTMSQQFQDAEFPTLSGCRVVRIATHPELTRAGYGTRALALLTKYYEGEIADLAEDDAVDTGYEPEAALPSVDVDGDLLQETLTVRALLSSASAMLRKLTSSAFQFHRPLKPH